MFCPNCGKQVKDEDHFCRYCGANLQNEESVIDIEHQDKVKAYIENSNFVKETEIELNKEFAKSDSNEILNSIVEDDAEEYVICDIEKHIMALFWPIVLTPIFFLYFWNIFLNTHSFISWVIVLLIIVPIIYPVMRYNSDKIIVTSKYIHIKLGVLNPEEISVPLSKLDILDLSQTAVGRMLDYGTLSFTSNGKQYNYGYIKDLSDLQYIIENTEDFVKNSLSE